MIPRVIEAKYIKDYILSNKSQPKHFPLSTWLRRAGEHGAR
jgi:hypothetical protein